MAYDLRKRDRVVFDAAASSGVAVLERDVLLADWARHSELPAGWLSLDAGDNDPARFWRHAVAALDRARPGIGERVGCSWPGYRCAGKTMWPGSWRRSPAATATSWTIWLRRCSSSRTSRCVPSCWRPRCSTGSAGRYATRSRARQAGRRCWSRWNGRACSWYRWMRCAAGGAITTCSPTCSAPACTRGSPHA